MRIERLCLFFCFFSIFFGISPVLAQCPDGDEITPGTNAWNGYVYSDLNTYSTSSYVGVMNETDNFSQPFCGDDCDSFTDAGCAFNTETFSVRYRNQQTFATCGLYTFTIESDYGVRFSLNGGSTFLINVNSGSGLQTYSASVFLAGGTYDLVLDYFHNTGANQISFSYIATPVVAGDYGGEILGDQIICSNPIDPDLFTSVAPARFCSGNPVSYQWESNFNNGGWNDVPGATSITFDASGLAEGTTEFRRRATDGSTTEHSNTIEIVGTLTAGDQVTSGTTSWIAYAYNGTNNFSSENYLGSDEIAGPTNFARDLTTLNIDGCTFPPDNFSIRLKRDIDITCGGYDIDLGSDGGVRLYIDGNLAINGSAIQPSFTNYTANVFLVDGTHTFVIEYTNAVGNDDISFDINPTFGVGAGGVIGADQIACMASYDPEPFTSLEDAGFCSGTLTYQWQSASNPGGPWTDIVGEVNAVFDEITLLTSGAYYYRRLADNGVTSFPSNVVSVSVEQPQGDDSIYPSGTWTAYAYSGVSHQSSNYLGYFDIATPASFDEDFTCEACTLPLTGCDLTTENFSVRFKSEQTFACGGYDFTIGAQGGGVRLFVDGNQVIDGYNSNSSYTQYSANIFLDGVHQLDVEYYNVSGANRVTFDYVPAATGSAGLIGSSQDICDVVLDPAAFTSISDPDFCSGTPTYQWESAPADSGPWADIAGADQLTYDIPTLVTPGITFYRRRATNGTETLWSNIVSVYAFTPEQPFADLKTPGDDVWIGYTYGNADDLVNDYRGYFTEPTNFDESFCGADCDFTLNGCPVRTETFSVELLNNAELPCGYYELTLGSDDGALLAVDFVEIITEGYSSHPYEEYTTNYFFDGAEHRLGIEYFEVGGGNRITFSAVFLGPGNPGEIAGDQTFCNASAPAPFTSVEDATLCDLGVPQYQWQKSTDELLWTNISGATSATFTETDVLAETTYYRRRSSDGSFSLSSNVITVDITPPQGDEVTFGENSWIGYVYTGNDFQSANYKGYITEPTIFDESFCGFDCTQSINGCATVFNNVGVRFMNDQFFACGSYALTIGYDDAIRTFSIDGAQLFSDFNPGSYREFTDTIDFSSDGTHELILEYVEYGGDNRIKFSYTYLGAGVAGEIASDQQVCQAPFDPDPFTSVSPPSFCSGTPPAYQWQQSDDGVIWANISGATSDTYDPPAGLSGDRHYRRRETAGSVILYSNTVTATVEDNGNDPTTQGTDMWIGHVYSGFQTANNFDPADYLGYFTEPAQFDELFCGADNCTFSITGCDIVPEDFSVRFQMQITLLAGEYTFNVDSDDGIRLSIDGGSSFPIDVYTGGGYGGSHQQSYTTTLADGTYDFVIEYFEGGADNRVTFNYSAILPVTWYYFNGYHDNGTAVLEWKTASELNNTGFEIEKSADGISFEKIGWVEGHGTTNEEHSYTFVDPQPQHGWNYYRLRQIDTDGEFEYSRLIPVYVDDLPEVEVYPNPFRDHLFLSRIEPGQSVEVILVNVIAQNSFTLRQDPLQPARFEVPARIGPGMYSARIKLGDKTYIRKVVIE